MPGKTGKRAKPVRPCGHCRKTIVGDFCRRPKADFHPSCFMEVMKLEKKG